MNSVHSPNHVGMHFLPFVPDAELLARFCLIPSISLEKRKSTCLVPQTGFLSSLQSGLLMFPQILMKSLGQSPWGQKETCVSKACLLLLAPAGIEVQL